MSGKKASEVNALLNNGEKTRSGAINLVNNTMSCAESAVESARASEKKARDSISELKLTSDFAAAQKEFPEAAAELEKRLKALSGFSETDFSALSAAEKNKESILSEYVRIDKEAETVREKVKAQIKRQNRSDPWYCDEEFRLAQNVQNKYAKAGEKVNSLKNSLNTCISSANKAKSVAESKEKQAKELVAEINNLQKKAADIVKLREKASKAIEEVSGSFKEIETGIAGKFLAAGYSELSKSVDSFLSKSKGDNKYAVNTFSKVLGEIAVYKSELDKVYAEYVERKNGVRASIDSITDSLNRKVFSKPNEELLMRSKERYSVLVFLNDCGKGKYVAELNELLAKAESAYEKDDFDSADRYVSEINALADTASDYAVMTHEKLMKTITTAITLQKVMIGMGYDVEAVENVSMDDGYKLICTAGDEVITYEKVSIDENGKPVIPIDHKESTTGTCGKSWYEIRQAAAEHGLFFEDITKNNKSVIFNPKSGGKTEDKNTVQSGGK